MRNLLQRLDVLAVRSAEVTFDGVLLEAELAPLLRLGSGSLRGARGRLVLRGGDPRHQQHDQHPRPVHASEPPRVAPSVSIYIEWRRPHQTPTSLPSPRADHTRLQLVRTLLSGVRWRAL